MGQSQSNEIIPYDANSWRRLSREYLNSLNSQQDLSNPNYGQQQRSISRSRQSLDWNTLNEASSRQSEQQRNLPRASSSSAIDRNPLRDNGYGYRDPNLVSEYYQGSGSQRETNFHHSPRNSSRSSNVVRSVERTRAPSPFTHLARFRTSPSPEPRLKHSPAESINRTVNVQRIGAGNIPESGTGNGYVSSSQKNVNGWKSPEVVNLDEQYSRQPLESGRITSTSTATTAKQMDDFKSGTYSKGYSEDSEFAPSHGSYQKNQKSGIRQQGYPSDEPSYERVHHIPYRDVHSSNQKLDQSRSNLNGSAWSVNGPPAYRGNPYFRRSASRSRSRSRSMSQIGARQKIGVLKCIFIFLILLNIASTIWDVVYMWWAGKYIERGFPLQGKLYTKTNSEIGLWQIGLILLLLVSNAVNIVAIWATLINRYWFLWIYVILTFIFGLFGAGSELLRGCYTAWLLPMLCGLFAIAINHHIALAIY